MNESTYTSHLPLYTNRLVLRPLLPTDADAIFNIRSNEDVNRYINRRAAETIEDAHAFIKMIEEKAATTEVFYRVICIENQIAGTICLFNQDNEIKQVEIGFELLPEFQGKGIMHEAVSYLKHYCFNEMKMDSVVAVVVSENLPSRKLLEKTGFIEDLRKPAGLETNELFYRLNKIIVEDL
jgi:[ribosomal protein S5]-alanine N-acetyltransferase